MGETPGKFAFRDTPQPQWRRYSGTQLGLIWAGFAILVFLVFLLFDGRPINWLQGVITALAPATILIAIFAWKMHERGEQRGPDDDQLKR